MNERDRLRKIVREAIEARFLVEDADPFPDPIARIQSAGEDLLAALDSDLKRVTQCIRAAASSTKDDAARKDLEHASGLIQHAMRDAESVLIMLAKAQDRLKSGKNRH